MPDLLDLYREACASRATVRDGATWYARAHRECERIAAGHGLRVRQVAGIVAALSPRMPWDQNVRVAEAVAAGRKPHMALGRNLAKAERIRAGAAPEDVLRGPKVRAFYRAILGDARSVVIDSWMLRACGHHRASCSDKQYRAYADLLRAAASRSGCRPTEFQAIVWVHIRKLEG